MKTKELNYTEIKKIIYKELHHFLNDRLMQNYLQINFKYYEHEIDKLKELFFESWEWSNIQDSLKYDEKMISFAKKICNEAIEEMILAVIRLLDDFIEELWFNSLGD